MDTPIIDNDQPQRIEPEKNRGGTWITFGTSEYRVPALGLRAVQDLQAKVDALRAGDQAATPEQMDAAADVIHAAIARNYPSLPREEVVDMLDLGNLRPALSAALGVTVGADASQE